MSEPKRYDSCSYGLEMLLTSGETGCLMSESHPEGPRVYTMLGNLMAVVSGTDDDRVVANWIRHCRPAEGRVLEIRHAVRRGDSVFDLLAGEVSGETLRRLGIEQMRHNLSEFIRLSGPAWFEPMNRVFVPNIHPDVDSYRMWKEVRKDVEPSVRPAAEAASRRPSPPVASSPDPSTESPPGAIPPNSSLEQLLVPPVRTAKLDDGPYDAFADNDRHRNAGDGEFMVERQHLDRVDLDAGTPISGAKPSRRYSPQVISFESIESKIGAANEVLSTVLRALNARGLRAIPLLQEVISDESAEFFVRLGRVNLDIRGRISMGSLQESLSLRPVSEHRRSLESGLVDLVDRSLDLCADHVSETEMERVLEVIAGVHQRLTS